MILFKLLPNTSTIDLVTLQGNPIKFIPGFKPIIVLDIVLFVICNVDGLEQVTKYPYPLTIFCKLPIILPAIEIEE